MSVTEDEAAEPSTARRLREIDDFVPPEIAMTEPGRFVVIKFAPDRPGEDWGIASIADWETPPQGDSTCEFIATDEHMTFDGAYARARQHADRVGAKGIAVYMIEGAN